MGDTLRSQTVRTKLQRIAAQAARYPEMVFTTLAHLIDVDFLREAHRLTRKKGAPGVDGVTAEEYAENLEDNLADLHERMRSGRYKAPPVERTWIKKEEGSLRPIGKPTFEDKIVQRAVAMLMGAIYEQDFHEFSYGFRPGRSPHQALIAVREQCMDMNINTVVDADVCGFFDNIGWQQLMEVIKKRVNDGALIRLIGKWLHAGVMENGVLFHPVKGTPQGGVISPILGNIFLHHVLDEWWEKVVKPRMRGRCFLVRFADDFVVGFELEDDTRRFMAVLPKRFGRFDLTIHPEKTRQIAFGKPDTGSNSGRVNDTFDFLGFTHYWSPSRRGYWVIKRKTARKRLRRTMRALWTWCRNNRHQPFAEQYKLLCLKLRGHYAYYGIRCNQRAMKQVLYRTEKAWQYWLSRRSHKGYVSWEKFKVLRTVHPLTKPRIYHSI
ncbi:MAG: group II intron reverse transcriptase/maturase [bacterium]|nr:group II intron reverse transcriptase/maturase [bacterium]